MSVGEHDPYTGQRMTGHEWNGIKELNTPVPKAVWFFLSVTALFAFVYWVLMPAWPLGVTYTKGLLGIDQREIVRESVAEAARQRSWAQRIAQDDYATIQADAGLMQKVRESGRALFGDNCAVCHGTAGKGGPGYPNLTAGAWLWGGTPEAIAETIRVGINSGHPEGRIAQMLAFGRDQMLDRAAVLNVVTYVQSLSDPTLASGPEKEVIVAGKEVYDANCASCHGPEGKGSTDVGAPDLTDGFWIYGGDRQSIFNTVYGGRQGHMPAWETRLSELDRKILTLYVLDLGGGK
ncbi:cytochrome-c oxidase, cbb3-type subunit III [Chelatococcus daeguensis]|uniref:Cbb3-type cytochrome c oxidase subunit n=1 Tax=Chelatococcus daeguensis TaxID=444444 RepID=A0AAC9NXW0_9HYPH|nr:cytochrome-c oxidase, cbb3-type subunit III [Chelatococcus daeguensis]APF36488.1 cytochrome-c oxidase, cbb3-type subunit III [Chelatococcus daeguensis]KZE33716.1 cytochrome C [Chelatococcus daeguensis]MBM3082789.1 cytochrome-c oxidase, cbb3-type subunit III [Chelatococcus daeguensis]